jgi:sugar/nucleoside kinase (ribokinase family)
VTVRPEVTVVSRIVLDELGDDGARDPRVELGGSGFWAAYGAAVVTDEVALACRVGADFGPWRARLAALGIRGDALVDSALPSSRTLIRYRGEVRTETPLPSWEAHVAMRTLLDEIPAPADDPVGWYVFRELHPGFWPPLLERMAASDAPLLWELPPTLCTGPPDAAMREVLARTEVLSLNRAEAERLVDAQDAQDAVDRLLALGPRTVLLRLGGEGSVVATGSERWAVSAARVRPVDVTGGGNAYSGAYLAAMLRGDGAEAAAVAATAAAATAIEQVGPPVDREAARTRAAELARTVTTRRIR